jgi:hypothetical protein
MTDEHCPKASPEKLPQRQEPAPHRAHPLPNTYRNAVFNLQKAVESVQRLHARDRFLPNQESLEERHWKRLADTANLLAAIADDLYGSNNCGDCQTRMLPAAGYQTKCQACRDDERQST